MAATTKNMDSPAYCHGHAELRRLERAGNVGKGDLGGDLRGLHDAGGRPLVSGTEGGLQDAKEHGGDWSEWPEYRQIHRFRRTGWTGFPSWEVGTRWSSQFPRDAVQPDPTQRAVHPPSIAIADPVIEVAKSLQRKSKSAAISFGGTNRLFG